MIPRTIRRQLGRLRRRERLLQVAWGAARWLTLAVLALAVACFTDWMIDRRQDTPWEVRVGLLAAQAALGAVTAAVFILWPLVRRMPADRLALWVEERVPDFDHRLISAVQLNRRGADTRGMSPEMIAAVTREAEERAAGFPFTQLISHRRLGWSAAVLAPLVVGAGVAYLFAPELVTALVARQFLTDRAIPRLHTLEADSPRVWPTGEEVVLRFRVRGPGLTEKTRGSVRVLPADGSAAQTYALVFDTAASSDEAYFIARIPPGDVDFTYRAWLGDGRTRRDAEVHYEPRPAIQDQHAWVRLPEYCGLRPDGEPYEQYQPKAEITGLIGASARVRVHTQRPVARAVVELLGQPMPEVLAYLQMTGLGAPAGPLAAPAELAGQLLAIAAAEQLPTPSVPLRPDLGPEMVVRRVPLAVQDDGMQAEGVFTLRRTETAYRVVVENMDGFRNLDPARRGVTVVPDEVPHVVLLPEQFPSEGEQGFVADAEVEGMPVPVGSRVRIAYYCMDLYGLREAWLVYRVNEGPWRRLPLIEVRAAAEAGPFDLRRGAFQNSGFMEQIQFHAVPSADPALFPGRSEGGGRFDFQTRTIPGLKVGDKLELFIEVFDRNPQPDRPPGRSETRVKSIVTAEQFFQWVELTLEQERRIRQLEAKQRGVFDRPGQD